MDTRNTSIAHNTEDKPWWYMHGEALERQFVDVCSEHLNIDAVINPEKKNDKTAPDLIVNNRLADLKTQNTPFFTAMKYRIDPTFAVTFNRKDYERYNALYPDIDIYFWIDWKQLKLGSINVQHLGGIFKLPFSSVAEMIDSGAPEHVYKFRTGEDDKNAKSSFILDIRKFERMQ